MNKHTLLVLVPIVFLALVSTTPGGVVVPRAQMGALPLAEKPATYVVEDIKDREPDLVALVDLTEGYVWDLPDPAVVLPLITAEAVVLTPRHQTFVTRPSIKSVPEPSTWLIMLIGFGLVGSAIRRNQHAVHQHDPTRPNLRL